MDHCVVRSVCDFSGHRAILLTTIFIFFHDRLWRKRFYDHFSWVRLWVLSTIGIHAFSNCSTKPIEKEKHAYFLRNIRVFDPKKWSGRWDLNPRLPAPKAGALPGCATPRIGKRRKLPCPPSSHKHWLLRAEEQTHFAVPQGIPPLNRNRNLNRNPNPRQRRITIRIKRGPNAPVFPDTNHSSLYSTLRCDI